MGAAVVSVALAMCGQSSSSTGGGGSTNAGSGGDAGLGIPGGDAGEGTVEPDAGSGKSDAGGGKLGDESDGGGDSEEGGGSHRDASPPDAGGNVLGLDPLMGWSSWSFVRNHPTESLIEAQAKALAASGLPAHGFVYVNIDDFYYMNPGATVDEYGRWVVDATKFPDGMGAVASYIHNLGLKFGMYLTPGIPAAAVNQNTPIEGTSYTAGSIGISGESENNYNFGGGVMYYIDYTKPGAQEFINSWANLLASYGVDYIKLDGVGSFDIPDVQAWSQALKATGREIHFELSNSLALADATTWAKLANGWRIDGDVECYCSTLTNWDHVSKRFADDAPWQPYSAPGARNDLDSLEVGNGNNDGLTPDERKTQMSLWSLAASPLTLGVDLTNLDFGDLALLTNDEVIAVDQAGVAATQVSNANDTQVWAAVEPDGSFAVGLFNLGSASAAITVNWSDLQISGMAAVRDLWNHVDLGSSSGSFSSTVDPHGVTLVRITP
jgi:alpha-galactosidase